MTTALSEEVRMEAVPPEVIVRVMITLDRAADDFLGDCRRRGWSERTIDTYRRTYDELCDRLPVDYDISKITTDDLRRYLAARVNLRTKRNLSPGSLANRESHLASLFRWLLVEGKIVKDPMAALPRTRRKHWSELDVVTVSTDEVRRLLFAAKTWEERLCIAVLVYTGCRRTAAANLKLSDYDRARGRLKFKEKGGKVIWKPVPDELDQLLEAAIAAEVIKDPDDYLIPNPGTLWEGRKGPRDPRIVWRLVKRVADRAGIVAHTHSLRAAFATFYLETHERDTIALQGLMGHRTIATTENYLRRLDREKEMERVRDLNWGVVVVDDKASSESSVFA